MKKALYILVLAMGALRMLQGCSGSNASTSFDGQQIEMRHARNLKMEAIDDGLTFVTLRNPWDTTKTLEKILLVEKDKDIPKNIPSGTIILNVPLERSIVYSGIHTSLIDELGALNAVNGVCDAAFITDKNTLNAIKNGDITDCGRNTSPNIERIVNLRPQAIILSPYEKTDDAERFKRIGIKVIQAADYMEANPLGRAEWMRFLGRLYGKGEKADSLFEKIEQDYLEIRHAVSQSKRKPTVMFDRLYSGVWSVPTSGSATGILITDAGAINPFYKYDKGGSIQLTAEEVYHTAQNTDIWLIRYTEPHLSLEDIKKEYDIYGRFRAYKTGNVYGSNTLTSHLFEDGAFHPNLILREMIRIFHPEMDDTPLRYYNKLK